MALSTKFSDKSFDDCFNVVNLVKPHDEHRDSLLSAVTLLDLIAFADWGRIGLPLPKVNRPKVLLAVEFDDATVSHEEVKGQLVNVPAIGESLLLLKPNA